MSLKSYEAWKKHFAEAESHSATEHADPRSSYDRSEKRAVESEPDYLNLDLELDNDLDVEREVEREFDLDLDLDLDLDAGSGFETKTDFRVDIFNDLDITNSITQISDVALTIEVGSHPGFDLGGELKALGGAGGYDASSADQSPSETSASIDDFAS